MENPLIITRPNGEKEQLPEVPDIHIGQSNLPKVDNKPMSLVAYWSMFFSYDCYDIDGRKLTREDVNGIMCMVYGPNHKPRTMVYDTFDSPEPNRGIVTMRNVHDRFRAPWIL